jgi:hypothetical protein
MRNKSEEEQLAELNAEDGVQINNVVSPRRRALDILSSKYEQPEQIVDETPNAQELLDPNQVNRVLKKQGFKLEGQEDKGLLDGLFHLLNKARK